MAGVGISPSIIASPPTEHIPAISAEQSISADRRVSEPMSILGLCTSLAITYAPAAPIFNASSHVSSLFAIPRTPSVPNILPIKAPLN